jgi:hypothetical protein
MVMPRLDEIKLAVCGWSLASIMTSPSKDPVEGCFGFIFVKKNCQIFNPPRFFSLLLPVEYGH